MSALTGPILVTCDGSSSALVSVPIATELARVLGAAPHLVYVGERELADSELPERIGLGRDQLDRFVVDQAIGEPAQAILEISTRLGAGAIVMCTRCTHAGATEGGGELGSIASRVASGAPCPLVLVNPERGLAPWRIEEVLLPYDGTPSTAAALRPAATLAKSALAHLFVVYVAQAHAAASGESGAMTVPQYVDQPQHEWPAWAGEFLDRLTCLFDDFDVGRLRLFVARGHPGREVVRLAREGGIDLIVVAWKGLIDPEHGGIAKTILRESPCPVLLLRTEPPLEGAGPCTPA